MWLRCDVFVGRDSEVGCGGGELGRMDRVEGREMAKGRWGWRRTWTWTLN